MESNNKLISFNENNPVRVDPVDQLIAFHGAADYLSACKLYKIYLISPNLSNHIFLNKNHSIHFLDSFFEYAQEELANQHVLFEENQPKKQYHLSAPHTSLLVLLAPPNLIVSIDGQLFLRFENIIRECVLGAYLSDEKAEFSMSTHFNMEEIRRWIEKDFDTTSDTDSDFDLGYA